MPATPSTATPSPSLPPLRFEPELPRRGAVHGDPVITMVRVWRGTTLEALLHRQRKTARSKWEVRASLQATVSSEPLQDLRARVQAVLDACEAYPWPDVAHGTPAVAPRSAEAVITRTPPR